MASPAYRGKCEDQVHGNSGGQRIRGFGTWPITECHLTYDHDYLTHEPPSQFSSFGFTPKPMNGSYRTVETATHLSLQCSCENSCLLAIVRVKTCVEAVESTITRCQLARSNWSKTSCKTIVWSYEWWNLIRTRAATSRRVLMTSMQSGYD